MKTKAPRAERLRATFDVVPSLVLAVDVLAVVVDSDWLVLLDVDVEDRLVLVVDVEEGLSWRSTG